MRVFTSPDTPIPEVQLLSNGRYHVMITNAGGGYSRWKDMAVTRWREDSTCDNWGTFCYHPRRGERRILVNRVSADPQASRNIMKRSSPKGGASSAAADNDFDTHTEIVVSPEDDIEVRRITITNRARDAPGDRRHQLRGGGSGAAGRGCTASGVQQSLRADRDYPPTAGDPLHSPAPLPRRAGAVDVSPDGACMERETMEISYETDRMRFIGRGNTVADPQAMTVGTGGALRTARARCWIR